MRENNAAPAAARDGESWWTKAVGRVVLVALGLAVGLGVASYRRPPPSTKAATERTLVGPSAGRLGDDPRVGVLPVQRVLAAAMQQQLQHPELANPDFQSPPAEEAPTDRVGEPTRDQLFLAAAQQEPRNEAWSRQVAPVFEADLQRAAGDWRARVGTVDCRSTRCLAELTFASAADAKAQTKAVMSHAYSLNCTRELYVPSAPGSGSVSATLVFECGQASQPIAAPAP